MLRKFPRPLKRIVVKIGSAAIADENFLPNRRWLRSLIKQIAFTHSQGIEIVVVSSGAIVLGIGELRERHIIKNDVASLQAFAAVGQTVLMRAYSELFKRKNLHCAQVLLTWDDFDNRKRNNNAKKTLLSILEKGVIPIVNENDTIAIDEIRFGDNDRLSAFVASLLHADLLIILSDVEGLYELKDGERHVLSEVKEITAEIERIAGGPMKGKMSKGGMAAKLDAIKIAAHARIPCIVASSMVRDVLTRIITGEHIGTYFVEKQDKILARKHWIAFQAKVKGKVVIDDGAKDALVNKGKSLLLPGIISWDGYFKKGDVVSVFDKDGIEIARGVINYSVAELNKIEDKKGRQELIHRNNLLLMGK